MMRWISVITLSMAMLAACNDGQISNLPNENIDLPEDQREFDNFVSPLDAARVAKTWLEAKDRGDRLSFEVDRIVPLQHKHEGRTLVTAYLVIFKGSGFVLVPADDSLVPVLGYSSKGIVSQDSLSEGPFRKFLTGLNVQIATRIFVPKERKLDTGDKWSALRSGSFELTGSTQVVAPLISTTWNQGDPYNRYTPIDGDQQSLVGCGAIAAGQIMNYHQYPAHGEGFVSYEYRDRVYSKLLQKSAWDFAQMPNNLRLADVSEAQKDETAHFLADVGLGIQSYFNAGWTGSFQAKIESTFNNFFRYDPDSVQYLSKWQYSEADWNTLMENEIIAQRPVFYVGAKEGGNDGHFFILDGLDGNGYFHVNWGWGGSSDGYFYLNALLREGTTGYNYGNEAIIGIAPITKALDQECGGYAGYPCVGTLLCKNKLNTLGICKTQDWCDPQTVVADCTHLEPGGNGFFTCVDHSCVWTPGSTGSETFETAAVVARDEWQHYGPFEVIVGGNITVIMTPANGDPDLYVREGRIPDEYAYHCRPYSGGTTQETCNLDGAGSYYVSINGYGWSSDYQLTVTYTTEDINPIPDPVCGDGAQEGLEACDSSMVDCVELDPGFDSGTASCNDTCSGFDISDCVAPVCGNGVLEGNEACEIDDTAVCTDLRDQWKSGTATCKLDCSAWDEFSCNFYQCGDGIVEFSEKCELGYTVECADLSSSWRSGVASCRENCLGWDVSNCVLDQPCGNGVIDEGEICDGDVDCTYLNSKKWESGVASCVDFCTAYDYSNCVAIPLCGNATLDEGEACDGKPTDCVNLSPDKWSDGEAACLDDCTGWDDSTCIPASGPVQHTITDWGNLQQGSWRHFEAIEASAGEFKAVIGGTDLGGTGDVDLYVRKGSQADKYNYDCRSNGPESFETCILEGPGTFYVSIYGYAADSDYTIAINWWTGVEIPDLVLISESGTVVKNQWVSYGAYQVHATGDFKVVMTGTGDADLYVKKDGQPSTTSYDCRPYEGDSDETCLLDGPGTYWVGVNGYDPSSDYQLTITYIPVN